MMQEIVIVGSGHLAQALWEGWDGSRIESSVNIIARSDTHRHLWQPPVWDQHVTFDPGGVVQADLIVLAVKPKDLEETWYTIASHVQPWSLIISPVAGWSLSRIRSLGVSNPLVRIMPNVCAAVGASTTLACFSDVSATDVSIVVSLFSALGTLTVVPESVMDPYTALLGSGPAYIFLLLEALIASGEQLGADYGRTRQLVSEMVEGAARLARDRSNDPLSEWISKVASPGGTTEALLEVLRQGGWPSMIQDAVVKASERAQQLGEAR